jgi:ferredoxin
MEIKVNLDVCDAHGQCVIEAPDLFELGDDDEVVTLLDANPPEEMRKLADRAVQSCPVQAITIED